MKSFIPLLLGAAALLVASRAAGRDLAPLSDGSTRPRVEPASATVSPPVRTVAIRQAADPWRYRWHNGQWWYWTPGNRWMIHGDGGWHYHTPGYVGPTYRYWYGAPRRYYYGYRPYYGPYYRRDYRDQWNRDRGIYIGRRGIWVR